MSEQKKQFLDLMRIFNLARTAQRDKNGCVNDLSLSNELNLALIIVGKDKIKELTNELYYYLSDPDPDNRKVAITSLGFRTRLHEPDFGERAYQIWKTDPDDDVRVTALSVWIIYQEDDCKPLVLKELYQILESKSYSVEAREEAYSGLLKLTKKNKPGEYIQSIELADLDEEEFEQAIDWNRVKQIMIDFVPNWKKQLVITIHKP